MTVEFDVKAQRVTRAQDSQGRWWRLEGKCVRCGACCLDCRHDQLKWERVNGQKVAACKMYWDKPWGCAVYPRNPEIELFPTCGYRWVRDG